MRGGRDFDEVAMEPEVVGTSVLKKHLVSCALYIKKGSCI